MSSPESKIDETPTIIVEAVKDDRPEPRQQQPGVGDRQVIDMKAIEEQLRKELEEFRKRNPQAPREPRSQREPRAPEYPGVKVSIDETLLKIRLKADPFARIIVIRDTVGNKITISLE